jgi:mono/diheme cytochrome c family protein
MALAIILPALSVSTAQDHQLERGQYLVMHVAMCVQCHTPRNEQGELEQTRLLQGAPMPLASPFPSQTWAFEAPKIAGLPGGWTEADLIKLLQTGQGPRGTSPRPPMPPFRMTQEDAAAVAAYLKSLQ